MSFNHDEYMEDIPSDDDYDDDDMECRSYVSDDGAHDVDDVTEHLMARSGTDLKMAKLAMPTTLEEAFSLARITKAHFEAIAYKEKATAEKSKALKRQQIVGNTKSVGHFQVVTGLSS
ncbi:hypothetical protein Tco_1532676 [Tanacetum coccineum]